MQNVKSFINLLGENYYLDFIIDPNILEVDYDKHNILVRYQDKNYYELPADDIQIRQNEIIKNCKILFDNSLTDIFFEISKKDNASIEIFLNFNIEAVKMKLSILKNDFYIDDKKSRYYSVLYDNYDNQYLETLYSNRNSTVNYDINFEFKKIVNRINQTDNLESIFFFESQYFFDLLYYRSLQLSILPFKLFQIGQHFILKLNKMKLLNKVEIKHQINMQKESSHQLFKDQYLKIFCEQISNERVIKETCFDLVYESIVHYVPYLETEIIENILFLNNDKKDDYLNYAIDKIKKTPFFDKDKYNIDKWLKKYDATIEEFPKFRNEELEHWLNSYYKEYYGTFKDREFILDIQIDFYCYAAMIVSNKMIDFLDSKKSNTTKMTDKIEKTETENPNRLSVNQAVIFLDKLGVFNTTMFENVSNVKKAKLVSQLLGRNDKNIKTAIEKLELKQKDITNGYQKDLDKIQQLLNNLE